MNRPSLPAPAPTRSLVSRTNTIWLVLLLATALTWWVGESGTAARASVAGATGVLTLATLKGVLIIQDYMELRHAPALWRRLLLGWLWAVVLLVWAATVWHLRG